MANALGKVDSVDIDGEGLNLTLFLALSGSDVNGGVGALEYVNVRLMPDDQPAAIRSKMSAAVSQACADKGWTVPGTNMTLPTFQKG